MLKGTLIHPQILAALGAAGHGSKVLIADGNYPHANRLGLNAELVLANFTPGVIDAVTALRLVASSVPIEKAEVMRPAKRGPYAMKEDPPIWADFRQVLKDAGFEQDLDAIDQQRFYAAGQDPMTCLTIATAEQQIYANILLTIGVVQPA